MHKVPLIVSHRRSGTHLLCKLLWENLQVHCPDAGQRQPWLQLHCSHTEVPPHPYVCVWRPVLPTMVSMWRLRRRFGMRADVAFAQMLREPFEQLQEVPSVTYSPCLEYGEYRESAHARFQHRGLLLDKWLNDTRLFASRASVVVEMSACVEQPYDVLQAVQGSFRCLFRDRPVTLVHEKVGWQPALDEQPVVELADLQLCRRYQELLFYRHERVPVRVQ